MRTGEHSDVGAVGCGEGGRVWRESGAERDEVGSLGGDVIGILDNSGNLLVSYTYTAFGVPTTSFPGITSSMSDAQKQDIYILGSNNPFRYRGYYFDTETGFYYLNSRYYDPVTGRFLNSDGLVSTGQGVLGQNMFAYCENNPVMGYDPYGRFNWGIFADIAITAVSAMISIGVGVATGVATLKTTKSIKTAVTAGVASGVATFGAINNTVNAVYYNYISDGESSITAKEQENQGKSVYVDEGYISRWERLDYTKQVTQEKTYSANAWRFQSEYSVHMYGWFATSWAYGKSVPLLSKYARNFEKANVDLKSWDPRPIVKAGTAVWGILGL